MLNQILEKVRASGGEIGWANGKPVVRGRAGVLSSAEIQLLRESRPQLDQRLRPFASRVTDDYPYAWQGQSLGNEIALDTETTVIDSPGIPQLVLATAANAEEVVVLTASQLDTFIDLHANAEFVVHNAAFDFWVIEQKLADARKWWEIIDSGRLHDTMLLDALLRLSQTGDRPHNRDLGTVAAEYTNVVVDKEDPYRLRFGELLDRDWSTVDRGFFEYAVADAIATWKVFQRLGELIAAEPANSQRFGLLTENIQVWAAVALADISRCGLHIDQQSLAELRNRLLAEIDGAVDVVLANSDAAGVFKRKKDGELQRTSKSHKPSTSENELRSWLSSIATSHGLNPPLTQKHHEVSTAVKYWERHRDVDEALGAWVDIQKKSKVYQFLAGLDGQRIHPRYQTLVVTGRTSCSGPNIQQLPRDGGFRELIVPRPGHLFVIADYSAIELRTLAVVCEERFGESRLAQVLRDGIDPHAYTAARFEGLSMGEFESLELKHRKNLRQRAKALNFGIPGGLGVNSLVAYARDTYRVNLTFEEAQDFRDRHIHEVYPEIGRYLEEDMASLLASNLRIDRSQVAHYCDDIMLRATKKVVAGNLHNAKGKPYGQNFIDRCWWTLQALNRNPELNQPLHGQKADVRNVRRLFGERVETLTGRIRAGSSYTEARNTPFQGLAADGAKHALWRLLRSGYRTVAFIHDEVVVEIPTDGDHTAHVRKIDAILRDSMSDVLQSDLPIEVEIALTDRWYKDAEAIWDDGQIKPWSPTT